jgi:hypothetical protein
VKKILFSFVGEQDPISEKTNEEGSIVTLYRYIKPDYVYLFPTAKGVNVKSDTEGHARETEKWIKDVVDENAKIYIRPVSFNPVVYHDILSKMEVEIRKILEELNNLKEDYEIHLNHSSGTPQLKNSWLLLAYARHIPNPKIWQVLNPQFAGPEERVEEIKIDFIEEKNIIQGIYKYAGQGFFGVVKREAERLKEISVNSFQKYRAKIIADIFAAYEDWDLIKYKEAYEKIAKVHREHSNSRDLKELVELLEKQKEYLRELSRDTDKETVYNLMDLYYNARRRFERDDYTETVARFWRIYEGTLYWYMRKYYNIEPTDLDKSENTELAQEIKGTFKPPQNSLSIFAAERVIEEVLEDKRFKNFMESEIEVVRSASHQKIKIQKILSELRGKRNNSIVAHGMKPVQQIDAENAMIACKELIEKIILKEMKYDIESYPFKREDVEKIIKKLLG